ncbi:GAF domain-containing protein [Nonomuraea sp. NPDC049141]|uniref:GAF domain-containing protein n=1 Tax=Nonomuraea sp. NPDC049141 TaxID=3155500 RepID=UPI00340566EA
MAGDDEDRIWALIAGSARRRGSPVSVQDVCVAGVEAVAVSGAGVSLVVHERLEPAHLAGRLGRELLEAELATGDGPCVEAVWGSGPVLVPDMAACEGRWPAFSEVARVGAVFAYPLVMGAVKVGVLVLCRDRPGELAPREQGDALILAGAALTLLLGGRGRMSGHRMPPAASPALGVEIYQAAGMVSAQLDISVEEALLRLRAYAFTHDEPLSRVARRVVLRRLRFSPDPSGR